MSLGSWNSSILSVRFQYRYEWLLTVEHVAYWHAPCVAREHGLSPACGHAAVVDAVQRHLVDFPEPVHQPEHFQCEHFLDRIMCGERC